MTAPALGAQPPEKEKTPQAKRRKGRFTRRRGDRPDGWRGPCRAPTQISADPCESQLS